MYFDEGYLMNLMGPHFPCHLELKLLYSKYVKHLSALDFMLKKEKL
jgi:hypothetical protein